jgi:hypothetical protein
VQAGESGLIAVFLQWSVDPAYRAKVPDDFKRTEEEVELAELPASTPSSKGGLSHLKSDSPMEQKRNLETAADGGACIPNAIPKPA